MDYITITIKNNEELNNVDERTLQDIFKKDKVTIRELIDELLDKHDQLSRQREDEDSEDFEEEVDTDRQTLAYSINLERGN